MSGQNKPDLVKRCLAAFIDFILIAIVSFIVSMILAWIKYLGPIIASAFSVALLLFRDALPIAQLEGASPGKKLLGLKAVTMQGANLDYEASVKRNLPLAISGLFSVLAAIISPLGFLIIIFGAVVGFIVVIIEIVKIFTDPNNYRFGDVFAGTKVIATDGTKEMPAVVAPSEPPPAPPAPPMAPPPSAETPPPPAASTAPPAPPAAEKPADPFGEGDSLPASDADDTDAFGDGDKP